eukprot:3325040-Rhodomonas_salina.1
MDAGHAVLRGAGHQHRQRAGALEPGRGREAEVGHGEAAARQRLLQDKQLQARPQALPALGLVLLHEDAAAAVGGGQGRHQGGAAVQGREDHEHRTPPQTGP